MPPYPNKANLKHRRALGDAFAAFLGHMRPGGISIEDDALRCSVVKTFRQAVERAAFRGVEIALCWSALGTWTESGKERIGYFSRALDCQLAANKEQPPRTSEEHCCDLHLRAECLFEIGRIHFHEGDPAVAREFFERALPVVREYDKWCARLKPQEFRDNRLEGKILELLLQLPDDVDPSPSA